MKQLTSLFLALLTLTATAQINYPFNPDENADAFISTPDLMEFLVVFGYEWEQEEIQVDSIPLSMYLSSLEAMIEASALPEGTNPGQFLQWNGEAWELVMPKVGCTLPEACNYDPTAHVLFEDVCIFQDECGVCDGPGAVYDCGCSDIPVGECDCEGNVVDALGACGGTCEADEDGDGICDDGDSCVGEADECGVCNGPGAIYGCGCSDVPEGACDCAGNVEDILGVCGGGCTADEDGDGICDDEDDCVGEYDGCGVCNGPGPVLGCGCNDIPEGYCDCNGNVLDAVGTCGGACQNDINGDGICDDDSIPGCTYDNACNYDPSASINDGSCDFTSCYGCTDIEACNYSPEATIDNGVCWYVEEFYLNCAGDCQSDVDDDGVCDELEVFGCTDEEACNFEPGATELDNSCTYPGCNDATACNFNPEAGCDDGSCVEESDTGCIDPSACNFDDTAVCGDDSCTYEGCTNPLASNFNELAGCDDGSCVVYGCTVELACNYEPTANVEDESCEFGTCPGCNDPYSWSYNPTSTNDSLCESIVALPFDWSQETDDLELLHLFEGEIGSSSLGAGSYRIVAAGGRGGRGGGRGAVVSVDVYLESFAILKYVAGIQGGNAPQEVGNGGGGGSFVWFGQPNDEEGLLLMAAGGGGGSGHNGSNSGWSGSDGQCSNSGTAGQGDTAGSGGQNGQGGEVGYTTEGVPNAGGGAGWTSSGESDGWALGGLSPSNGGEGGGITGGFGGGGGSSVFNYGCGNSPHGGSGGGGYSGGGGGGFNCNGAGGGGGSYSLGNAGLILCGDNGNYGDGYVQVWVLE